MLTLDDINAAPSDPVELNKHLQMRGLIPLPPPPPPPVNVAPMSPVAPHNPVAPMVPPVMPEKVAPHPMSPLGASLAIGGTAQPTIKPMSPVNVGAAPDLGGETTQPMGTAPGAEPTGIAPMVPPKAPTAQESIAAGLAQHPEEKGDAKEEGKRQFNEMRPVVDAPVNSSEFWKEKIAQQEFDKAHPWGGDISAHPGVLGKIGHTLGEVGQIAGGILAPGIVAGIPGTRANRAIQEQGAAAQEAAAEGREGQAAERATQAKNVESEVGLRGAQQTEAEQKTAKEATEQNLEKDSQGNITGWKGPDGKLHSLDEEGTPQAIKDIAEASKSKEGPKLEKSANGDIVQITTDKDGKASSQVVYHGDPKVETELTSKTVGGQEHHLLINKATGETVKDLGAFKTEPSPAAALKAEQAGEEPVIGFDKDGIQRIMPRSQAQKEGLTNIVKSSAKDRADSEQNTSALNDMTAKVKNIVKSSEAIDKLSVYQKTLIQQALKGHPDDMSTRLAISLMDPKGQQYVQDVFSLREASLGLPKQITGGSRVSEPQATALFNTIPGSSGDHAYRLSQLHKFDENLDRLSKKVPRVEGNDLERAFTQEKGGGAQAGPPGPPDPGMKWQQNKKTGEYRQTKTTP